MDKLEGKVAVITGAASGIGAALAVALDAQGMHLVLVDVEEASLSEVAGQLSRAPAIFVVDVSDANAMSNLAEQVYERYSNVHLLINNAGVMGPMAPLWEQTAGDFQWVFGVNVMGIANGIRAFVPRLLAQSDAAHIVNTASEASFAARAFVGVYHASKHAVLALTETLAQELEFAKAGIRVSVLCPGAVNTRVMQASRNRPPDIAATSAVNDDGNRLERVYHRSLERGLAPEEVARVVIDGVRANRFYLLPHPEVAALPQRRADAVAGDIYPTLDPGMAQLISADGPSVS